MEEVTQQGKEIIKTALRRLLREAVTLKIHIDKIAEAGTFCAAFITRVDPQCQGGRGPSTCRALSWAWRGDADSWGPAGVGVGVKEGRPAFGKNPGVFSTGGQHPPPSACFHTLKVRVGGIGSSGEGGGGDGVQLPGQ